MSGPADPTYATHAHLDTHAHAHTFIYAYTLPTTPPFSFADSDSVFVHIIKSEQHAAMQHELGVRLVAGQSLWLLLGMLLLLLLQQHVPRPIILQLQHQLLLAGA